MMCDVVTGPYVFWATMRIVDHTPSRRYMIKCSPPLISAPEKYVLSGVLSVLQKRFINRKISSSICLWCVLLTSILLQSRWPYTTSTISLYRTFLWIMKWVLTIKVYLFVCALDTYVCCRITHVLRETHFSWLIARIRKVHGETDFE